LFFRCITNGRPATAITMASFTSNYSFCNSINNMFVFKRCYKQLRGWSIWGSSLAGARGFSFLHLDLLGEPPSLVFRGYQGSFPGVKRLGLEVQHSSPYAAKVKSDWNYTYSCRDIFHVD